MNTKTLAVALGSLAAIAGASALAARKSDSRSEEDDDGDGYDDGSWRRDPDYRLVGMYVKEAIASGKHFSGDDGDDGDDITMLDHVASEASRDTLHEMAKTAIRRKDFNSVNLGGSPSYSYDTFVGIPPTPPGEWPQSARWMILATTALQARSAHDKLANMPVMSISQQAHPLDWMDPHIPRDPSGRPLSDPVEVIENLGIMTRKIPSTELLLSFAKSMAMSADDALAIMQESNVGPGLGSDAFNDSILMLVNLSRRGHGLERKYEEQIRRLKVYGGI